MRHDPTVEAGQARVLILGLTFFSDQAEMGPKATRTVEFAGQCMEKQRL